MRGFAVLARRAGRVGHIHEEQRKLALRALWESDERAVPRMEGPKNEPPRSMSARPEALRAASVLG
jgi:hypothetical protein